MSIFAIGDIHGCRKALETLMQEVDPTVDDQLVFLGDYVNRGPDSRGVIEFLLKLEKRRRCIFLRGNHEVMTLEARQEKSKAVSWRFVGGSETLRSYDYWGEGNWWEFIPAAHWDFFQRSSPYFETAHHIFVHACLQPDLDLAEQPDSTIYWERFYALRPHKSGKKVICGHTADLDGEIQDIGFAVCIDTAAVLGGWLTCLNVETGEAWQANEKGIMRKTKL